MNKEMIKQTIDLRKSIDDTVDVKEMETKLDEYAKTKAVVNTTTAGNGKEAFNASMYKDEMYTQLVNESPLLSMLPGNHGDGLAVGAIDVTIKGEIGYFQASAELNGTDAFTAGYAQTNGFATGTVQLPIKQLDASILISTKEVKQSTDTDLLGTITSRFLRSGEQTITRVILNADSATSGNINGTVGATDARKVYPTSIRKEGIANGVVGAGTLSRTNTILPMFDVIDEYAGQSSDLLFVTPFNVWNRLKMLQEYSTIDVIGSLASNVNANFKQLEGVEAMVTKEYPKLTEASGKINDTVASNNLGSMSLFYKPAIQFGFGDGLEVLDQKRNVGGYLLQAMMYFGATVVNGQAGLSKTVATSAGITL